jgi:hypothetical protein
MKVQACQFGPFSASFDDVESVHLADCVGNRFCSAPLGGLHVPQGIPWFYGRRMGTIWQIFPADSLPGYAYEAKSTT